jgi:hypothetical protein
MISKREGKRLLADNGMERSINDIGFPFEKIYSSLKIQGYAKLI